MSTETQKGLNVGKEQQTRIIPLVRRQGKEAVPARYKNRPALIRAWLHRAWVIADEQGLSRGTLAVLQAIIASGLSTTHPYNHIFTKRATLARLAQVGEATVYRALDRLEAIKLITRIPQHRLTDGSLYLAEITITDKFAELFEIGKSNKQEGITTNNSAQEELISPVSSGRPDELENMPYTCRHDSSSGESAPSAEKMIDEVIGDSVYEEQEFEPKASVYNQFAGASFVRRNGRSVPQELVWLIDEKRLTFGGLFKLMSMAKQVVGQKLSDFVLLRIERLKELPSHKDCYRYLKSLITQGIDARYLCKEQAKKALQATQKAKEKRLAEDREKWIRSKHGHVFINQQSGQTYQIDADYNLLRLAGNNPNLAINTRFIRAVESGALTPYVEKIETTSRERTREILRDLRQMLKVGMSQAPIASTI